MQAKGHTKKMPAPQCPLFPSGTTPGKGQAGQHIQGSSEPKASSASASLWTLGRGTAREKGQEVKGAESRWSKVPRPSPSVRRSLQRCTGNAWGEPPASCQKASGRGMQICSLAGSAGPGGPSLWLQLPLETAGHWLYTELSVGRVVSPWRPAR